MGSLLVIGLAIIAILPVIGIIFLYIYKVYNDFKKKRFEKKGNIVLTRQRIGDILKQKTPSESLRIFKSGICDHTQVEGVRYYTNFPFGSKIIMAHDNHRKAFIAHEIGEMLSKMIILNADLEFCSDILLHLTGNSNEAYYTQLIAWNSLSKLASFQKSTFMEWIGIDYLSNRISKDFITGIGVIKFIFNLKGYNDLGNASAKIINDLILYTLEKAGLPLLALLVFKLSKSLYFEQSQKMDFMKRLPDDPKFKRFLDYRNELSLGFTKEELREGLMNLGLQSPPYSKNTTEGEIVQFLIKDFLEDIYVPASYMLHSFDWDDPRQQFSDFLWI